MLCEVVSKSAKPRKKYRPYGVVSNPVMNAMVLAACLPKEEQANLIGTMKRGIDALRTGVPVKGHDMADAWRDLADAVNVGEQLMKNGLANDHAETFSAAQRALAAIADRANAGKGWTLYAQELEALKVMTYVHKVQITCMSGGEFRLAVRQVQRRTQEALRGNGPVNGVITVAGRLGKDLKAQT